MNKEKKATTAKKKVSKGKKAKSFEASLWNAANKLRGSVEPAEYKHVVLSLIFLKYAGYRFEKQHASLLQQFGEQIAELPQGYAKDNVFYLPPFCRWDYIMQQSKQPDLATIIDKALAGIEKVNPLLEGALPNNYYSRLDIEPSSLASLLDVINGVESHMIDDTDFMGRVYEYFLANFALQEGKGKGEYYTPKCIVNLIAELIEPYKGKIYDPCCGSGGMFVQSNKFIEAHGGNKKDISIYGQEKTATTYKLAKMNLAIRGIAANLGERAVNTFTHDQHKAEKFDFIMANPPFNIHDWREENELVDDPRWKGFVTPPTSNANYAWILNIYSKLATNGVAGFLLANGALSGGGDEQKIRARLVGPECDAVEAIIILPRDMFYTTDISVTLWILNRNKHARTISVNGEVRKYRERSGEILFMDLRTWGEPFEKKYKQFSEEDIQKVALRYHQWQRTDLGEYKDEAEYCCSVKVASLKNSSLVPSKYIEYKMRDNTPEYKERMKAMQQELSLLFQKDEENKNKVQQVFAELGFNL